MTAASTVPVLFGIGALMVLGADVVLTVFYPGGHGGPVTRTQIRAIWEAVSNCRSSERRPAARRVARAVWSGLRAFQHSVVDSAIGSRVLAALLPGDRQIRLRACRSGLGGGVVLQRLCGLDVRHRRLSRSHADASSAHGRRSAGWLHAARSLDHLSCVDLLRGCFQQHVVRPSAELCRRWRRRAALV